MADSNIPQLTANPGKHLVIETDKGRFARYPVKTHVIMNGDKLFDIMDKYVKPHLEEGDSIYLSEKMVAITQGRAFPISEIKPRKLAYFLVRFVYKSPYGIGLGSPYTMELALRDVGIFKILLGAFCAAVTKPFGIRGVFYRVVGPKARAIDGPCDYAIPPYNKYAKMAPKDPDKVCRQLSDYLDGRKVVIIDANDLGLEILGKSHKEIELEFVRQLFKDNPLDQADQQTPIAIGRRVSDDFVEPEVIPAPPEYQ